MLHIRSVVLGLERTRASVHEVKGECLGPMTEVPILAVKCLVVWLPNGVPYYIQGK